MGGCLFHSGQSSVRLSGNILTGTFELFHTNTLGVPNLTKLMIEIKHQPQRGVPVPPNLYDHCQILHCLIDLSTTCNCVFVTIAYWLLYIPLPFPFLHMVAPVRSCCFLLQFPGNVLSGEEPTLAHKMNEQLGWGWDPVSRLLAQRAQRPGFFSQHRANWLWCYTSVTPALWR